MRMLLSTLTLLGALGFVACLAFGMMIFRGATTVLQEQAALQILTIAALAFVAVMVGVHGLERA